MSGAYSWSNTDRQHVIVISIVLALTSASKYYDWRTRDGKANEHNALVPRDHWLDDWEKTTILDFEHQHPREGYRRLAFMMIDSDVVAVMQHSSALPRLVGWCCTSEPMWSSTKRARLIRPDWMFSLKSKR